MASWFRPRFIKAGAVKPLSGSEYDEGSGVQYVRYEDGLRSPGNEEAQEVQTRLEIGYLILTREARRLQDLESPNPRDALRLQNLIEKSCAEGAVRFYETVRKMKANPAAPLEIDPIDLLDPRLKEFDAREAMQRIQGDNPEVIDARENLHKGLEDLLPKEGQQAVLFINSTRPAGHAAFAENIRGQVWLFELFDGVAVPLGWQRPGVVGVTAFYSLSDIQETGAYHVVMRK